MDFDFGEETQGAEEGEGEEGEGEEGDDGDDKEIYCFCQKLSYGEMIACDNPDCPYQWVSRCTDCCALAGDCSIRRCLTVSMHSSTFRVSTLSNRFQNVGFARTVPNAVWAHLPLPVLPVKDGRSSGALDTLTCVSSARSICGQSLGPRVPQLAVSVSQADRPGWYFDSYAPCSICGTAIVLVANSQAQGIRPYSFPPIRLVHRVTACLNSSAKMVWPRNVVVVRAAVFTLSERGAVFYLSRAPKGSQAMEVP